MCVVVVVDLFKILDTKCYTFFLTVDINALSYLHYSQEMSYDLYAFKEIPTITNNVAVSKL